MCAVRSDTLLPATHTNATLLGGRVFYLVDPGSPDDDANAALAALIRDRVGRGDQFAGVVLTHRHRDHTAGAPYFVRAFACSVWAHPITAAEVSARVTVTHEVGEGSVLPAGDGASITVWHTPGHARGHIVLIDPETKLAVVGDMVAGEGSILIAKPDGHVAQYIASLRRLRQAELAILVPAHGPVITQANAKLDDYIAHRLKRDAAVLRAVQEAGPRGCDVAAVVAVVYATTPTPLLPWAALAAAAHLDKLVEDGAVSVRDERYYASDSS